MKREWKRSGLLFLGCFTIASLIAACATTPPGTKRISTYGVLVPEDTNITPPPADLPQEIKDLLGPWGNGCWQGKDEGFPLVFIVKSVTRETAKSIYSYTGAESRYWRAPPPIPYKEGEAKIIERDGKYLILIEDKDADIRMEFWREGEFMAGKLLRRYRGYTTQLMRLKD